MSNESLTCSNSSFIVDLPILIPNSDTLLVVESHVGNSTEVGKVSLPEALLKSGIPLTGTQVDTWVQSNSCNIAAATAWFLVNNVKTSKNNTWVTNTSSFILSATNWVALNSARLADLNLTVDNLTDTALQAGSWVSTHSAAFASLSSEFLSLSSDNENIKIFTNWIAANSSTINSTVSSLTSLLIDELLEQTFHNWVTSNSSSFDTALTVIRDLTSDGSFQRNATHWVSSVSADVNQTLSWFKVLTSVRELHETAETSVFAWVTSNSSQISDILEKNSAGFLSWVSANSAQYETVYSWYVDNQQDVQSAVTWTQNASSRVGILEGVASIAVETAIDTNTWVANNSSTYAKVSSVSQFTAWVASNSSALTNLQDWYGTLSLTAAALQGATDWIATNGDAVVEAAQWIDTLVNSQLLHDAREDQVLSWVESNSADINVPLNDPNATIALAWAADNSATILQTVNWVHLLTSTQEAHEEREANVFSWVETHSSDNIDPLDTNVTAWVQDSSSTLTEVKDWYTSNQLHADVINPVVGWVNTLSDRVTQAADWVEILSESQNLHDVREDQVLSWVEQASGKTDNINAWVEQTSTAVEALALVEPLLQTFQDTADWYSVSSDVINAAVTWIAETTSSLVSQIQLEAVRVIFNPTKTWVTQNSSSIIDAVNYTALISATLDSTTNWIETNSASLLNTTIWAESVSASVTELEGVVDIVNIVNSFTDTNSWVQDNSSVVISQTPASNWVKNTSAELTAITAWVENNSSLAETNNTLNDTTTWIAENSGNINSAVSWVTILTSTQQIHDNREDSVFTWVESNSSQVTDQNSRNWVENTSADINNVVTWVENNSSLAQINNILTDTTTWVNQNSSELESVVNWVTVLTSTQQIHDNREDSVFTWVESNSSELENIDTSNLEWLNQTRENIVSNITWVNDNSSNVIESYLATRAQAIQLSNLTTWVTGNSSNLKDIANWVNDISSNINSDTNSTTWVQEQSSVINQVTNWVHVLTSVQQTHDLLQEQVFAWVETNSGNVSTIIDDELITWVQNNSSDLTSVKEWYIERTLTDSQINDAITWVNETSSIATKAAEWVSVLSSAQQVHDEREDQIFAWVETNSGNTITPIDSQSDVWVQNNSASLVDIQDWSNDNFVKINDAITWVNETSSIATKAAEWVSVLSSAQQVHDEREDQVISWVEANSSNTATPIDSQSDVWVEQNSSVLTEIEDWYNNTIIGDIAGAVNWVTETSALATKAAEWVDVLSSAQQVHDEREDLIFTWVEANSGNITDSNANTDVNLWVQNNSSTLTDIENWSGFESLDVTQIDEVVAWVSETSSITTRAAEWVSVLSSAQQVHDEREDQAISWVETNSSAFIESTPNTDVNLWVQSNSGALTDIENWSGFESLDVENINAIAGWVNETSSIATKAAEWVSVLSSAQQVHDEREDQIFAWVETNSSNITDSNSNTDVNLWVQSNSGALTDIENWSGFESLDVENINAIAGWVNETSSIATKAAEWVSVLSSAQQVHDEREDQAISWVEVNSGVFTESNANTDVNLWVQSNSSILAGIENWSGFESLDATQIDNAITWVNETSSIATKAAEWVSVLSSAQQVHDEREDQIFAWVETNSSNITDSNSNTDVNLWVQSNSGALTDIENWAGFESLDVTQIDEVVTWVNETSSIATKAAEWVSVLSSAQQVHDEREDQIFAWVETNSGNTVQQIDTQAITWVQENSSAIQDINTWEGFSTLNIDNVNTAVAWVNETSSIATKAAEWVSVLSSAQQVHDEREDQIFAWVETNSSENEAILTSADVNTWVQDNSSKLIDVESWYNENHPDTASVVSAVDWYNTYGERALQAAEWVDILSETQNLHDVREDQVLSWVEANSANVGSTTIEVNNWVASCSTTVDELREWYTDLNLDVNAVTDATNWVNVNSAATVEAVEWVHALSSLQEIHENVESQVFAWVENNSANVESSISTWVREQSSIINTLRDWYTLSASEVEQTSIWLQTNFTDLVCAINWVQENEQAIEILNLAVNNTLSIATNANRWVSANFNKFDTISSWVTANSSNVRDNTRTDIIVDWVENNIDTLTDIENWYDTRSFDENTAASAVSWVQEFSARATAAALWFEVLSGLEEGHEELENQVITWVTENSGIKATVTTINTWLTSTSSFTNQVDNWVAANSADLDSFAAWWHWLSSLEEGHAELEGQVIAWVCEHSADVAEVDTWVREHSAGLLQAETWVECSTAFFYNLSAWAISNSAEYEAAYSWVSINSARVMSATMWVETWNESLVDLYNFYAPIENWLVEVSGWWDYQRYLDDAAGNWVADNGDVVLDNIGWLSAHRVEIENTITWAHLNSAKYEQAYAWTRDYSAMVLHHEAEINQLNIDVAVHQNWIFEEWGPTIIDATLTTQRMSALWILSGGDGMASDPCSCVWTKPEPITNPLGTLTYHQDLRGWTLKEILEAILYTTAFSIVINPQDRNVCPAASISFEVSAIGGGNAEGSTVHYQWYKDSQILDGETGNLLVIPQVATEHAGQYFATASNDNKTLTSTAATLTVKSLAAITRDPVDTTLITGQTLRLSTVATGTPPLYYQWTKNGTPIQGATGTIYTLTNVVTANGGTYAVSAWNSCNAVVSNPAVVVVNAPVVITLNPASTTVNRGTNVTLTAAATGTLPIQYQWLSGDNVVIEGANTTTLTTQESGTYKMVACNIVNCVTSLPATINFNVPPTVTITPHVTSVLVGTRLVLSATEITGVPTPTLKWLKNGAVISGATSSTYTINSVLVSDAATYTLSATNIAGSAYDSGVVTVNQGLVWITHPQPSAINPGQTYCMTAVADGTSPINYRWLSGANVNNVFTEVSTLAVNNTSFCTQSSGYYQAVASNVVGSISSNKALVSFNTLQISLNPISQTVTQGSTVVFTASAIGTQPITYKWHYNGNVLTNNSSITGATSTTLTLTGVQQSNAGNYVLEASNIVGSVSTTVAILDVTVPAGYTIYWGKVLQSYAALPAVATLTATDATIRAINTYYTTHESNGDFPLGAYSQGLVAVKSAAGFKNIRINTEDFNRFFICDSVYSKSVLNMDEAHTLNFIQTPSAYGFTEFFAANPSYTPGQYVNMKNTFLMIFVPVGMPGTLWNKITDTGNNTIGTLGMPTVTTPLSVALFTNGVSSAYYSYRTEADTQALTRILTHS